MELNVDQKRIIETKPGGHMLIRGVAGSGKTTVAVHKIPHLLNHYCSQDDKVLVITFTKTLINYINYIYNNIEHETTLFSMINSDQNLQISTADKIIFHLYRKYEEKAGIEEREIIPQKEKYRLLNQAIKYISKKYPDQTVVSDRNVNFLIDEIEWIKSNRYTELEVYQNVDRLGRSRNMEEDGPQRILKNSTNREAIFKTMVLYDELMDKEGYTDFKNMALQVLKGIEEGVITCDKFTHILVDESQDLSRVQLEIIKNMFKNDKNYSSVIFIADTAQSIYLQSWLSHQSFKSIGFDMSGRARTLSKNYRTTAEIAEAAYSLIEDDQTIVNNENYVEPAIIDRRGEHPVYKQFDSDGEELDYVCDMIKNNLYKHYDLKDIAIIAKTRRQLENAKRYLLNNKVDCKILSKRENHFSDDKVKLLTMHSIKGLEYKVVFIIGINENVIPYSPDGNIDLEQESMERRLLYVGMTRAKDKLFLTSSGNPSKFINDINPKYLKLNNENGFSRFNHIGIDSYRFKEKIVDLYSHEEVVRQWVIEELINTLNYPLELIDIEYEIQLFSATGYVDIVVFKNMKGKIVPYIFIEAKHYNTSLDKQDVNQLKSYLEGNSSVEYGMLTNGKDFKILKKQSKKGEFEYIDSLPDYQGDINSLFEEFEYIDLKRDKKYKLHRNLEDKSLIHVYDEKIDNSLEVSEYVKLNVYGELTAGELKYAHQDIQGDVELPKEIVPNPDNCFMLEVTGDSMINAGIDKGDYVIVQKQNYAENLDIVVAVIDQEATLKKYSRMGDTILLMPENKNYEPIIVSEEDLIINGKVIGVLKT
ncbi:transcriptional repressor LexA [Natranaerobius thermophilus]|uniref:DNA 3'-5' helicase n=1 Tax=Natranaerobius thermophilus (strain ATCC BAA-1301 / DSM 18059 / JW/NM-WN-LF) TaxID=457570 RepID=B2A7U7_NATTJ|nr:transcriptional repressor LexA [Natranaerobius thermophilus]ACB84395.1 LexA repressor [Natranaerobius thermophilus JW/NM-WN-LF]